jgi:hypothetical protein
MKQGINFEMDDHLGPSEVKRACCALMPNESHESGGIMKSVITGLLVLFAIYVFYLMISSIDFKGMSFSDIKLVVSVCAGIAVSIFSVTKGTKIIYSALTGFVTGAILYALILTIIQAMSK